MSLTLRRNCGFVKIFLRLFLRPQKCPGFRNYSATNIVTTKISSQEFHEKFPVKFVQKSSLDRR